MEENSLAQLKIAYQQFQQGYLASAERTFHAVLQREPENIHALNLLGILYRQSGQPIQAIEYLSRALAINDNDPQTHGQIGLAYKDINQFSNACNHLERAATLAPTPENLNNWGGMLRSFGDPIKAAKVLRQAVSKAPGFAEAWSNYAAALKDAGRIGPAVDAVNKAISLYASLSQSHNLRGELYQQQGNYAAALTSFETAHRLKPREALYLVNRARALRDLNKPDEAMASLQHALKADPIYAPAGYTQGLLYEQMGNIEQAAQCFKNTIAIKPTMAQAHHQLVQMEAGYYCDEFYQQLLNAWRNGSLNPQEQLFSCFVFYRWLEQQGQFTDAFQWLRQGNERCATQTPAQGKPNESAMNILVQQANLVTLDNSAFNVHPKPVFVVGLPRSGTSLTEQILASHSQIRGLGEQGFVQSMAEESERLTGKPFPYSLPVLNQTQWQNLAEHYLANAGASQYPYLVDKTPLNFQYIGMLANAFPNALFIHCHRNPVSNGFAIYRLPFDSRQHYAHNLTALGQYYREYWQLMNEWKALYPHRIHNMCYENTVHNTEQQVRELFAFLGLAFEQETLMFHHTNRLVTTPSASQVRKPIYQRALSSWEPYRAQLTPLIEALGDLYVN